MSFVVDTDTCSALLGRNDAAVVARFLQHTGGIYISAVTLAELYTWAYRGVRAVDRIAGVELLLNDVALLPVDLAVARMFGEIRAAMLARGLVLPTPDLLIAATALEHNFTIVTHNVRHFSSV